MRGLVEGWLAGWMRDREGGSPRAVYEHAIRERTRQYAELKQAVAGVLYMRNKLEAEIQERRRELEAVRADIESAVKRGLDGVALELISNKDRLLEELERTETELEAVVREAEAAKGNLVRFRGEIQSLEREKVRILATLANAKARRRIQEALDGLSLEPEMRALDAVREHAARLQTEGNLERELEDPDLRSRVRALRDEARHEASRQELDRLKRKLRGDALPDAARSAAQPAPKKADVVVESAH